MGGPAGTDTASDARPVSLDALLPDAIADRDDRPRYARDPETFWASHLGFCPRQTYLSKLGLKDLSDSTGRFAAGRVIQSHIAEQIAEEYPWLKADARGVWEGESVRFVGRLSLYDPAEGVVYHVKARNGWYKFTPPVERHLNQLQVYMAALGADRAQILYVSLADLGDIQTWPPQDDDRTFFEFDAERFEALVEKAEAIRDEIFVNGIATSEREVPFDPCGCYFCDSEALDFPDPPADPTDAIEAVAAEASAPLVGDGGSEATMPEGASGDSDPPLAFIDLDDVRNPETGDMTCEASRILGDLGAYAEVSRSGTGVHAYVRAGLPGDRAAFAANLDGPEASRYTTTPVHWRNVAEVRVHTEKRRPPRTFDS